MASLPAQLDQLSYRIQKKLAEDEGEGQLSGYIERLIAALRSSSSTNKLKELTDYKTICHKPISSKKKESAWMSCDPMFLVKGCVGLVWSLKIIWISS